MTDQPDTLAMLRAAMDGDLLCNATTGRYLSDHIEELIEGRVKAEREACAKACADYANRHAKDDDDSKAQAWMMLQCAAAIRARSET